ncbi:MAG: response regulator [Candidatus Kapabacteria bacterium]|nr:response regulator [Candidatus Kapabacteria bacterium]
MKKKILIVEDEEIIRVSLSKALELNEYNVQSAPDGGKALEIARSFKPDLIVSDILMPVMNGKQLLEELQKDSSTSMIPFLFLTALSDKSDVRRGMQLGADDYITKPFDINELISAIRTRLNKHEKSQQLQSTKINNLVSSINRALPHEFRTPISIIMGFSDYILKKVDTISKPDLKDMIANIKEAGERLSNLFEQYLFYASLEAIASNNEELKKARSKKTPSIEMIISDLVNLLTKPFNRRDDFEIEIDDCAIAMSEDYFVKLMQELIENSMKFSQSGSKVVIIGKFDSTDCHLEIKDHGRGMSNEQITTIGAYVQFERGTYEQQGAGLGLAILNKIAEVHGGKMTIQSELQKFTIFKFRFPLVR